MRYNYKSILFVLVFVFGHIQTAISQNKYVWVNVQDSLKNDHPLMMILQDKVKSIIDDNTDSAKAEIKNEIKIAKSAGDILETACGFYLLAASDDYLGNYQNAIQLYQKTIFWAEQTNNERFIATLYSRTGYVMSRLSQYDSALVYYNKALVIREKNHNILGVINTKNFIGVIYQRTGQFELAFKNYMDALKLITDSNFVQSKAFTYTNISSIFIKTGNYKLAEKYLLEALKIRKASNNESLIAHSYRKFAKLYYEKGEIDSSIEYGLNAVTIFKQKNWQKPLPSIYNLIGLCYLSKKEYIEANNFFQSSKTIAEKEHNHLQLVQNSINFGRLFLATHKYKEAIKQLESAIEKAKNLGLKEDIIKANQILAEVYFNDKQYKQAFITKKQEEELSNELFSSSFAEQISGFISSNEAAKANLIFELQQKEWNINNEARLKEERLYKKIYFSSVFIFLVFIFILFRSIRSKIKSNKTLRKSSRLIAQKQEEILKQKDTLERQKKELTSSLNKQRKLTKAIEQSSSTVVITDLHGHIEYVNPKFTETTGYTFEEAIGKNPRILKAGSKPKSFYNEMWETLLNGKEWHGEFENVRKNGEVYFESASIASVIDDKGEITNFIAVKDDITIQKQVLNDLEELNAIQTKIISVIGHDLRSPLGSIKSLLEILVQREYVIENPELLKIISVILKSIISVNLLSENLLNWANSWQKKGSREPIVFNLSDKVDENIMLLTSIANQKNIKINSNLEKSQKVYADPDMISTVIRNLIANAIKFTQIDGEINISATKLNDKIEISVKDNGVGIKKDLIPILLDEYDLYTTTGTEQEKGSGLGLSICLQFVKINNGQFSIKSEEGKGSTFSFTLPLKPL